MALQRQDITGATKDIIARIKSLTQAEKITIDERKLGGWRYAGSELETEIESLNAALGSKFKVLDCNAFHFVHGANIQNPTKRLLMIPLNGTPKLKSGEPLLSESCYYTEEGQQLFGREWDIILAALAVNK